MTMGRRTVVRGSVIRMGGLLACFLPLASAGAPWRIVQKQSRMLESFEVKSESHFDEAIPVVSLLATEEPSGATNTQASSLPLPSHCTEPDPGPCELCTDSDRSSIPICRDTGRRQSMTCSFQDSLLLSPSATKAYTYYNSCARTAGDDEFLFVRFQVMCLLTGAIAIMIVRKQKIVAVSLFDQRKLQKHRSDNNITPATITTGIVSSGAVEMTPSALRAEESKSLLRSSSSDHDALDVV